MESGIYRITNIVNNKCYIGSSKDIKRRIKEHFRKLHNNNHPNKYLQAAFNKYGFENFIYNTISYCKIEDLLELEQLILDEYDQNKLYNLATLTTGGGANVQRIPTLLIDLKGNVIKEYESIQAIDRDFNTRVNHGHSINKPSIFRRQYRIVTKDFYEKELKLILSWRNFNNAKEQERKINKFKKQIIVIINNKEYEFKSQKEASDFLNITRERVRQILHSQSSKKFKIKYKYPELQIKEEGYL